MLHFICLNLWNSFELHALLLSGCEALVDKVTFVTSGKPEKVNWIRMDKKMKRFGINLRKYPASPWREKFSENYLRKSLLSANK